VLPLRPDARPGLMADAAAAAAAAARRCGMRMHPASCSVAARLARSASSGIARARLMEFEPKCGRYVQEVRGMVRARKLGTLTPVPYAVDLQAASISMERVAGSTVKALLHSGALAGDGAAPTLPSV